MKERTEDFIEATERPDSIWLHLDGEGVSQVVDWEDVNTLNGDYGNLAEIVVVGIPLYGSSEDVLDSATRYVFNQIEIHQKTKENKELFESIG